MLRVLQQLQRGTCLHYLSAIHDHHLVSPLCSQPQIMGYEQHGRPQFGGHGLKMVQDLTLHSDVERRRRFVRNQQPRLAGQADGDEGTLAHPA